MEHVSEDTLLLLEGGGGALLDDRAVLQDNDFVRTGNRPHTVRNNQHRLVLNQAGQRLLNGSLIFHVKARRGLVQQSP